MSTIDLTMRGDEESRREPGEELAATKQRNRAAAQVHEVRERRRQWGLTSVDGRVAPPDTATVPMLNPPPSQCVPGGTPVPG